jgi:hypothetical protein
MCACRYDEFDNALEVMMAHDAVAWEHVRFKDVAVKCSTVDIFYKAIQQYFDYHPDLVNDLLKVREFYNLTPAKYTQNPTTLFYLSASCDPVRSEGPATLYGCVSVAAPQWPERSLQACYQSFN